MPKPVSLNPDDFTVGGGLLDDVDVTFVECRFTEFDYGGKGPKIPAAEIEMLPEGDTEAIKQYYSIGDPKVYKPSNDGKTILADVAIRKSSNFGIFCESLIRAGFPKDLLAEGDISTLSGLKCHVLRKPAPKRTGLRKPEREYEETILEVTEIIEMPGEGKKGKKKEEEVSDVEAIATEIVLGAPKPISKKDLIKVVFEKVKDDPGVRNKVLGLFKDDSFLNNGPWEYSGGVVE